MPGEGGAYTQNQFTPPPPKRKFNEVIFAGMLFRGGTFNSRKINETEIESNQIYLNIHENGGPVRGEECKDFQIGSHNKEISCVLLNDLKTHAKH